MELNKKDYSFTGKLHLTRSSIEKIKNYNKITYFSQIYENGLRFKYGVIEVEDFIDSLTTWNNFFVAGRFQKPVYELKSNTSIKNSIDINRRKAYYIATLLSNNITTEFELLNVLCSLSYMGTLRMKVAENPHKVENIVIGSYDRLKNIYNYKDDYLTRDGDKVVIDHKKALEKLWELPEGMLLYFLRNKIDFKDIQNVRRAIKNYLIAHNRKEELKESFDGLRTNGIIRSTPYLLAKVKKRIGI